MSKLLFSPVRLGVLQLANRVIMAPMTRDRAGPGDVPTELMAEYYRQRASAGLIITEGAQPAAVGKGYWRTPGIHSAEQVEGWRKVADAVHAEGGLIVVQLMHCGRVVVPANRGFEADIIAPSAIACPDKVPGPDGVPADCGEPRAILAEEIPALVEEYAQAARNAVAAGLDGVELHCASGYLINQFLNPVSNHRTDAFGGSIENRARLLLEVMRAVTAEIGGEHTGLRLSPVTPANDVLDANPQALFEYVLRELAPLKLAFLHLIEGATGGARDIPDRPFDYAALQQAYRTAGGQAAWMANNGYDKALANQALTQGVDLVAFGRPFIANPDLVQRLRADAPLNAADRTTFYGGGEKGYTDYPTLAA